MYILFGLATAHTLEMCASEWISESNNQCNFFLHCCCCCFGMWQSVEYDGKENLFCRIYSDLPPTRCCWEWHAKSAFLWPMCICNICSTPIYFFFFSAPAHKPFSCWKIALWWQKRAHTCLVGFGIHFVFFFCFLLQYFLPVSFPFSLSCCSV